MIGTSPFRPVEIFRGGLRALLVLVLVFPFLLWIYKIERWQPISFNEIGPVLLLTVGQSLLSATVTMAAGFILFRGLMAYRSLRTRRWAEFGLLMPNFVSATTYYCGLYV